ncbi:MAG: 23S rRNA (pseudouridine(1915)-N(3))-methyltransferase RlmH [bacterium]
MQLKETTTEEELIKKLENYQFVFALSEEGMQLTSRQFTDKLKSLSEEIQEVAFVIGGADGFSKPITFANKVFSLSKMTFTHEMALLFLIEQLYRAEQISKGTSYHRD